MHKYTNKQLHKYTNTQMLKYTNTQMHKYTNTKYEAGQIIPALTKLNPPYPALCCSKSLYFIQSAELPVEEDRP